MNVVHLPLREYIPYSECNHPDEFFELSQNKQNILVNWIRSVLKPYEIEGYSFCDSIYELKRLFQEDAGFYITNGEIEGAMIKSGFEVFDWMY